MKKLKHLKLVKVKEKEHFRSSPYKYYGNMVGNKFKIVTVTNAFTIHGAKDKRKDRDGTVCGNGNFNPSMLKALLLAFGEKAENLGHEPPTIIDQLNPKQIKDAYAKISIKEIHRMLSDVDNKSKAVMPSYSMKQLESFDQDKLFRIYCILKYSNTKRACPALKDFFKKAGYLNISK